MGDSRLRERVQDIGLTAALLFIGMMGTRGASENREEWTQEPGVLAYGLVALAALPFVFRRRYPVAVLGASGAAVLTYLALGYPFGPIMLTIPVAAYTLGSRLPHKRALRWVGGYYAAAFVVVAPRLVNRSEVLLWSQIFGWAVVSLAAFGAPLAIGAALRSRRLSDRDVRAAQARRAVSEERLRMAQELHDSVGHGLAVIAMQAGVALHVLEKNPAKVREALEAIRDTSKESLDGLRAQLEVLRVPSDEQAPRGPAPGLDEAEVLLERVRAGGVEVHAELNCDDVERSPEVDVAAYRILQEALTNVLRHSGASRAEVRVVGDHDSLVVDVTDNGAGAAAVSVDVEPDATSTTVGSGIAGMRARAEALGGSVQVGPRAEGGFMVRARLPLRSPSVPGSPS